MLRSNQHHHILACRCLLLSMLLSFAVFFSSAASRHLSSLNHFGNLCSPHSVISGNLLVTDNASTSPVIAVDTFSVQANSRFTATLRIANLHNAEGKSYRCTHPVTKKSKRISNPSCGMVWNYTDKANYYAAVLNAFNSNPHDDIRDQRLARVRVVQVCNGVEHVLRDTILSSGIDLHSGYNVFVLNHDATTDATTLSVGNTSPVEVARLYHVAFPAQSLIGFYAGCGAMTQVERLSFSSSPIPERQLLTSWTRDSIFTYLQSCRDPYEGLWEIYDYSLNFRKLRIGGNYRVAIIANSDASYDIIYVDGATVNSSKWKCGMLKGKLIPTPFSDNYTLLWYDAMMKPFPADAGNYAIFDDPRILSISFPAENGKLRLTRHLE